MSEIRDDLPDSFLRKILNVEYKMRLPELILQKIDYSTMSQSVEARSHGIPLVVNHLCGMLGLFFSSEERIDNLEAVKRSDTARFARFFHHMLDAGVNLAPSAFEAIFIGSQHNAAVIDATLAAADRAFAKLAQEN